LFYQLKFIHKVFFRETSFRESEFPGNVRKRSNCTKFRRATGWSFQSTGTFEIRHVAPFRNHGDSKATKVESRGQISHFSTSIYFRDQGPNLCLVCDTSDRTRRRVEGSAVWEIWNQVAKKVQKQNILPSATTWLRRAD